MRDHDFKRLCQSVSDPIAALQIIIYNDRYLGYDPYFADLRAEMLGMCERIITGHTARRKEKKSHAVRVTSSRRGKARASNPISGV